MNRLTILICMTVFAAGCYDSAIRDEVYYPRRFKESVSRQLDFRFIYEVKEERGVIRKLVRGNLIGYLETRAFQIRGTKTEKIIDYIYDTEMQMKGFILDGDRAYKFDVDKNVMELGRLGANVGIPMILDYKGRYEIEEAQVIYPIE